ncbi:MAG: adenine phosphoribosyltransferase [Acidimicrobiales bacterium]
METRADRLGGLVRDIPDFPTPGVVFKDITPLLADADAFAATVDFLVEPYADLAVDQVVGVEARGFILAGPVAYHLGAGFVPVRKAGKLPWAVEGERYALEYGTDLLEIHADGLAAGSRVVVIDDVLATGGTAAATVRLVEKLGGHVVGLGFVIELGFLSGRRQLAGQEVTSLLRYPEAGNGTEGRLE